MDTIIQKFHSGWAYLAILLLVIVIINSIAGYAGKKEFTAKDRKIALFGLIGAHIQLLIGLVLYFVSPLGYANIAQLGMGEVMKNPALRLTAVEHPTINIIAVILITVGWSMHKKKDTSEAKFKSILIFYAIGALLILSRIPWNLWM